MVTRLLPPAVALLVLLSGCTGGDDAEAKQAALVPADPPIETPVEASAAAAEATDSAVPPAGGPESSEPPTLGRESFSYTGGARDPFTSLLDLNLTGPELPDLALVAIYYETRRPANSVVIMREKVSGKRYNLRPGDRIGRIRVSAVRPKDVTFTIDDFGTTREVTLALRKTEETQ